MVITKHYVWNIIYLVRISDSGFLSKSTSSTLGQKWDILGRLVMVIIVMVDNTFRIELCLSCSNLGRLLSLIHLNQIDTRAL